MVSAAVGGARARRATRTGKTEVNIEWFIDEVQNRVDLSLYQRMLKAVEYLQVKVVKNISVPVTKQIFGGRTRVTERSKPGEFPRADTTELYKTIFKHVVKTGRGVEGYIGTTLDYGAILETSERLRRSFIRRTAVEELDRLGRILGAELEL